MQAEALWLYEWGGLGRYLKPGVSNMQNKFCETPVVQPIVKNVNVFIFLYIIFWLQLFVYSP